MFNLLKSDFYRLVHGKMLWVALIVLFALMAMGTGLLTFAASPEFAQMVNAAADANMATENVDAASDLTAKELQTLNEKKFDSLSYATAQMALVGGLLGILSGLVVGLFIMSDFATGFAKVILSSRKNRTRYYAEKLILVAIISAVFVIAAMAFIALVNAIAGFTYDPGESAGELVLWAIMAWLLLTAYNFIVAVVAWLTRSKVATVLAAVFISSTVLESFILEIIGFVSTFFPLLGKLAWLFPSSCINLLGDGGAGLLSSQPSLLFPFFSPAAQITLVCAAYIIVCVALAFGVCKRKDVYYR